MTAVIFVTGDVHDMSLGGADQQWLAEYGGGTEVDCALRYARLARRYDIPVTLFITGRAVVGASSKVCKLADNPYVELGGHTWRSLKPDWLRLGFWYVFGSYYGPARVQCRDIHRTLRALSEVTGVAARTWRTHSYRGDSTTYRMLDQYDVEVVSDAVGPTLTIDRLNEGPVSLPINTPPDHEHLSHGFLTKRCIELERRVAEDPCREWCRKPSGETARLALKEGLKQILDFPLVPRPFGQQVLEPVKWREWLLEEVEERIAQVGFATLLLHPADMWIADGMKSLEWVFQRLSSRDCRLASEATSKIEESA